MAINKKLGKGLSSLLGNKEDLNTNFNLFFEIFKQVKIALAKSFEWTNSLRGLPLPNNLIYLELFFFACINFEIIAGITCPLNLSKLSLIPYTLVGIKQTISNL